ncbi:MAG: retroviral-like aspartic protease family protein, partial [Gammaproteobacteria bacterium]
TRTLQTVNGITDAKTAQLEAIEIGNRIIADVGVAFVKDELLGKIMLLGMNVLGRYRLTIDDKLNQITLTEVD